jgi:hypothetical protein
VNKIHPFEKNKFSKKSIEALAKFQYCKKLDVYGIKQGKSLY